MKTAEETLKDAIVGVVCDELDYEHGNFQYYKEEVLQATQEYSESYARIQIEKDRENVKSAIIKKLEELHEQGFNPELALIFEDLPIILD